MPEWGINLLVGIVGVILVALFGRLGRRLNNVHLGTMLGVGIFLLVISQNNVLPLQIAGATLMAFAGGVWTYRYFSSMGGKTGDAQSMFCTKCGTKNDVRAGLCVKCGAPVTAKGTQEGPLQFVGINPTQEAIVVQISPVSDMMWGGIFDLILTDRRIVVDYGRCLTNARNSDMYSIGAVLNIPTAKGGTGKTETGTIQVVNVEYIIKAHRKNYVIENDDVKKIELRRKSFTRGRSDFKVKSTERKVHWVFTRDEFDVVSSELSAMFGDKVEVK